MKKKFLTRRGFTIVEVMVAFVIFAIMAGMVSVILSGTMQAKQENTDLEAEITQQQNVYYAKTQEKTFDSSSTEKLTFNFADTSPLEISYSVGDPNADGAGNQIALEYFVGDVDYSVLTGKSNTPQQPAGDKQQGSVANRFKSTNIYGSNGLTHIQLLLKRDDSDMSVNRYFIAGKAIGDPDPQYDRFKQYRLIFPSEIKKYGYCKYEQASGTFRDKDVTSTSYDLIAPNKTTLRVSSKQASSVKPLTEQGFTGYYVELASPLEDISATLNLQDIFGYSDTDKTPKQNSDGSFTFGRYQENVVDDDGKTVLDDEGNKVVNTHVNVFAAAEKPKATS